MAAKGGTDGIMSPAEMKPLLHLARRQVVSCAITMDKDKQGIILLHRLTKPRKLLAELKRQAKAAGVELDPTTLRFGHVSVDGASDSGLATFTVNKPTPGPMRRAMLEKVRPAGLQRCEIVVDKALEDKPEDGGDADGSGGSAADAGGGTAGHQARADSDMPTASLDAGPVAGARTREGSADSAVRAPADAAAPPAAAPRPAVPQLGQDGTGAGAPAAPPDAAAVRRRLTGLVGRVAKVFPSGPPGAEAMRAAGYAGRDALAAGDLAGAGRAADMLERLLGAAPGGGARGTDNGSLPVEAAGWLPQDGAAPLLASGAPGQDGPILAVAQAKALASGMGMDPALFTGRENAAVAVMLRMQRFASLQDKDRRGFPGWVTAQGFPAGDPFREKCVGMTLDFEQVNPRWAPGIIPDPVDDKLLDRLGKALEIAVKLAPADAKAALQELARKENLAKLAGFMLLFVAAQLTPAGWVADLVAGALVLGTALAVGVDLWAVLQDLDTFMEQVNSPRGSAQKAGEALAHAAGLVAVDVLLALVMGGAGAAAKAAKRFVKPGAGQVDVVTSKGGVVRMTAKDAAEIKVGDNLDAQAKKASGKGDVAKGKQGNKPAPVEQPDLPGFLDAVAKGDMEVAARKLGPLGTGVQLDQLAKLTPVQLEKLHATLKSLGPSGSKLARLTDPVHRADLGDDPSGGQPRPNERDTALRVELKTGVQLRRYAETSKQKGDWIDDSNRLYDGCSPPPAKFFDYGIKSGGKYEVSLRRHLEAPPPIDYIVVDVSGLGLAPAQLQALDGVINSVAGSGSARIVRIP